jgi:AbiV family abortive infection protein
MTEPPAGDMGTQGSTVSVDTLMQGYWFALEQAGYLIRDAGRLYRAESYASSVALALLGHEEIGRARILLRFWTRVDQGDTITKAVVVAACSDHVGKQRSGPRSLTYRVEGDSVLGDRFDRQHRFDVETPESVKNQREIEALDKRYGKRLPDERHARRMQALYVDLNEDGTGWDRPRERFPSAAVAEPIVIDAAPSRCTPRVVRTPRTARGGEPSMIAAIYARTSTEQGRGQ